MRYALLLAVTVLLVPASVAQAAVVINEVAWMGDGRSYTNEWIELRNTGSESVDVSGWILSSADDSPQISLDGSIAGGGYFLLERTDDQTAPDAAADQVYSGSLSNSGETLTLADASGSRVDRVAGGDGWQAIGGSNESKETAQKTTGGWVTAPPTPGAANVGMDSDDGGDSSGNEPPPDGEEDTEGDTDRTMNDSGEDGGSGSADPIVPKELTVQASVDKTTAVVNTPLEFSGEAYYGSRPSHSAHRRWNFGNGDAVGRTDVGYTYEHPGRYTAVFTATTIDQEAKKAIDIQIVDPDVSIAEVREGGHGYVELVNNGERRYELSGWKIVTGGGSFLVPEDTYIRAGARLRFSADTLRLAPVRAGTQLRYPNGDIAAIAAVNTVSRESSPAPRAVPASRDVTDDSVSRASASDTSDDSDSETGRATTARQVAMVASSGDGSLPLSAWFALGLAVLGAGAIVLLIISAPRRSTTPAEADADDFTFVE